MGFSLYQEPSCARMQTTMSNIGKPIQNFVFCAVLLQFLRYQKVTTKRELSVQLVDTSITRIRKWYQAVF